MQRKFPIIGKRLTLMLSCVCMLLLLVMLFFSIAKYQSFSGATPISATIVNKPDESNKYDYLAVMESSQIDSAYSEYLPVNIGGAVELYVRDGVVICSEYSKPKPSKFIPCIIIFAGIIVVTVLPNNEVKETQT